MAIDQKIQFCKHCEGKKVTIRNSINHLLHLLLSVFSAGLWLPVWLFISVIRPHFKCTTCGNDVGF